MIWNSKSNQFNLKKKTPYEIAIAIVFLSKTTYPKLETLSMKYPITNILLGISIFRIVRPDLRPILSSVISTMHHAISWQMFNF